jgi:hypothetical protein
MAILRVKEFPTVEHCATIRMEQRPGRLISAAMNPRSRDLGLHSSQFVRSGFFKTEFVIHSVSQFLFAAKIAFGRSGTTTQRVGDGGERTWRKTPRFTGNLLEALCEPVTRFRVVARPTGTLGATLYLLYIIQSDGRQRRAKSA